MKTAETLLTYMDWLHKLAGTINIYIERGLEIFQKIKVFIQKAVEYIEKAIDALVQNVGGRKSDSRLMTEDYLFV